MHFEGYLNVFKFRNNMVGIFIGLFLSIIFLIAKQSGRNIKFRVLSFSISFLICLIFLLLTDLGWWNIIVLPILTLISVFVSLYIHPLTLKEAFDSKEVIIHDYYNELASEEQLCNIKTYGFKQGYERLLMKILYAFTSSNSDVEKIMSNLYSHIYYPISELRKETLESHVYKSLENVINESNYLRHAEIRGEAVYGHVFNIFLCILQINEEATDDIKRLKKESEDFMHKNKI